MAEENAWLRRKAEEPNHVGWYVQRFRDLAAEGADLAGEARMIDAMVPRGARILDAGSGTGRVGSFLAAAGHEVVGVDLDPELVAVAEQDHPGPTWLVGDLAELDLPAAGVKAGFDAVVCAGNVIAFVAPSTRVEILRRFKAHLGEGGRVVVGFGSGRGYAFDDFLADAAAAGLSRDVLLSTWDLRPYTPESDFLVALFH
ncbi:class I SAM-dependent methyltransferase [Dactylosporangium sp. CS-033363]|uniref:class I SAM-dependent methyltransferase n=1 Tax=Dactylosporangium sp. CS-033363 TaxID=3239935 RepID=UPI003D8A8425